MVKPTPWSSALLVVALMVSACTAPPLLMKDFQNTTTDTTINTTTTGTTIAIDTPNYTANFISDDCKDAPILSRDICILEPPIRCFYKSCPDESRTDIINNVRYLNCSDFNMPIFCQDQSLWVCPPQDHFEVCRDTARVGSDVCEKERIYIQWLLKNCPDIGILE